MALCKQTPSQTVFYVTLSADLASKVRLSVEDDPDSVKVLLNVREIHVFTSQNATLSVCRFVIKNSSLGFALNFQFFHSHKFPRQNFEHFTFNLQSMWIVIEENEVEFVSRA